MTEAVQRVFRRAAFRRDASRLHDCHQTAQYVGVAVYRAGGRGKHKIKLALRALQLPILQRQRQIRTKRDGTSAAVCFWRTDNTEAISALTHVQLASLQINVGPAQPALAGRDSHVVGKVAAMHDLQHGI